MLDLQQRLELYRFFARIFSYPDHSLSEDLSTEIASAAALLRVDPPRLDPFPTLADLEVSFTELFISRVGGVPAPPYGSVYLEEGQLMGQTTLCVLRAYEGEGLNHQAGGEPADFLATEMEFLYYLLRQEMNALDQGNLDAGQLARQKQIDFWQTLLHPWIHPFCQRLVPLEAGAPLYCWAAGSLAEFSQHEERLLSIS